VNAEAIQAWDGPLFDRWVKFRHIVTAGLAAHGDIALALVPPQDGQRVLDIGCGLGDTTQQIAALVGTTGEAVGVDAAANFIETAAAEASEAGVENARFLVADVQTDPLEGPYDIAFSLADTATDAVNGDGDFDGEQDVSTLGRIYSNYTQVVVQADSGIDSVEDFKGKRISTGSPQSGTEVIANRMIEVAGLQPGDVKAQRLDLDQTVAGMKDGSIDGLVWSGGLPTPAITDLFTSMGDKVKFIDVTPLLPELKKVNEVYEEASIPADTYDTPKDVPSIAVPNVLMVRNDMAENLACALTTLMIEEKGQLEQVHPAAAEISAENAAETDPVPLHPGSERALEELNQ